MALDRLGQRRRLRLHRVALQLAAVEDQPLAQRPVVGVARFGGAAAVREVARDEAEGRRVDAERDGDGALVAHHAEQAGARGGDARGRRVLDDLAADVDEEREADELPARELRVRAAAVPLVELGGDARLPRRHRRARLHRRRTRRDVRRVEVDRLLQPDRDNVGPRRTPQPVADRLVGRRLGRDVPARRDDVDGIARRIVVDAARHVARHPLLANVGEERRVVLLRRPSESWASATSSSDSWRGVRGSEVADSWRRRPRRSLPIMANCGARPARRKRAARRTLHSAHRARPDYSQLRRRAQQLRRPPLGPRSAPQA